MHPSFPSQDGLPAIADLLATRMESLHFPSDLWEHPLANQHRL